MIFLAIVIMIGAISVKRSLMNIEKSTSSMEKYAYEIYQKSKKMEIIIDNLKKSLSYTSET